MSETTPARNFRELKVWQKGHSLVLGIYPLTGGFPKHELFGLTSQMRRAAVSVPANIAEAFGRRGKQIEELSKMLSSDERTILASARMAKAPSSF